MPQARTTHPTPQQLLHYGLGKLPENELAAIHDHVAGCAECRSKVESLPPDSFIGHIRAAQPTPSMMPTVPPTAGSTSPPLHKPAEGAADDVPTELLGSNKFEVLGKLGQGGMGAVYKARHTFLGELVAIKVMNASMVGNPDARVRFLREMQSTGKLKHKHIVRALDAEEMGDLLVLVMEFVPGIALDRLVQQRGALPIDFSCRCIAQAALGLQHAHEQGMVHRDIKPGNLIVTAKEKEVKLLDFGLARGPREQMETKNQTQLGAMMGTPGYMAPEQATDARSADIRADIYSLGCSLYFLLAGRPPFQADSIMSTVLAHIQDEPQPLTELRSEVPTGLWSVVARMLAKKPEERFQTPIEVARALQPFFKGPAKPAATVVPQPVKAPVAPEKKESPFADLGEASPRKPAKKPVRDQAAPQAAAWWKRPPVLAGVATGVLALLTLGVLLSLVILRVETPNGTLLVEIKDDEVEARIKNGKLILTGSDGKVRYTLTPSERNKKLEPGAYKIHVEGADGLTLNTTSFTLKKGDEVKVRVTLDQKAVAKKDSPALDPDRKAAEYVVSIGGVVRVNDEVDDLKTVADLPHEPFRLTYVNLAGNPKVRNAQMGAFDGCKHLTVLRINETPLNDQGLAHFKDCANLKILSLFAAPVTGDFLAQFKDCSKLEVLELERTRFYDAALVHLQNCKNLVDLRLLHTQVTDKGMVYLKNCKELKALGLAGTKVTDVGLAYFKDCKKLTRLRLHATQMTDKGLAYFKGCTELREFDLGGTRITATGLADFKKALPKCRTNPDRVEATVKPVSPAAELEALKRDKLPLKALTLAGDGDPKRAPASLVAVLGEPQPIHSGPVSGVAFSPDGCWLASGSHDKTIMLRDTATGRVKRVLKGHTGAVSAVAFSKDGRTLVSASHDGTLKLWPMEKEEEPQTLKPNFGELWTMAASPDGRFVAAGGPNGTIKLWKWGQWQAPMELPKVAGKVTTLAFNPDGKLLASGWEEGKPDAPIRLYTTGDGKLTQTLSGQKSRVNGLAFRPDGKALASVGSDPNVRVWDLASGKPVVDHDQHLGPGLSVAWGPDVKKLAIFRQYGGNIALFDVPARTQRTVFPDVSAFGLVFGPDSKVLAFGSSNGGVHLVDVTSMKEKFLEGGHRHHVTTLAFGPDGRTILSGGDDSTIRHWPLDRPGKNQIVDVLPTPVNLVAFSPDGKTFASAIRFRMTVWDAATGKERFGVTEPYVVHILAYSPNGKTLAGCGLDGIVRLWDVRLGKEVHRFPYLGKANALSFSGDGTTLAAASYEKNRLKRWTVASGAESGALQNTFTQVNWQLSVGVGAAFSPEGRTLATGHADGAICFWDVATGEKQRTLRGHTARVHLLKFTLDGKTLVSSGCDGTIRVWNSEHERAREVIPLGPANCPLIFDIDRSGKYLVAAGHSPVIFILRLPEGNK
jgi:WD40 repeat protein/serine/threonine protein kinase